MGELYDLAVIGGGINGAALAELAAQNGYSVALLEQNDFGSGVTSRSTRLIHGGLRYLEHGQVALVRESLREREAMLVEFPHQVRPQPFLIPVYRHDSRAWWWIRIGLEAYQWIGRSRLLERHRRLSAREVLQAEPGLRSTGLQAGFLYYDAQAIYPERLALDMALSAEEQGALVRNHEPVTAFLREGGNVAGVRTASGDEFRARLVVNAAGPWVDRVRALLHGATQRRLLTLLNGAHLVTGPFPGAPAHAIYHEASSDRRPFFIVPWRGLWLIGTTETPYEGDPGVTLPTAAEIEYLVRETNLLFPEANLRPDSVLYSMAGPRPLVYSDGAPAQAISREHAVYDHEKEEGIRGMVTVAGGKLTTARALAHQTLQRIAAKLKRGRVRRIPRTLPSMDGVPDRLLQVYGRRAAEVAALIRQRPELDRPVCPAAATTAGELLYAVEREKARTLADLLLRRTGLGFEPCMGLDCAAEAAAAVGWDAETAFAAYRKELDRTLHRGKPA